jgi:hypothetical protein
MAMTLSSQAAKFVFGAMIGFVSFIVWRFLPSLKSLATVAGLTTGIFLAFVIPV